MHPLDEFEKWFEAQPKEIRSDCSYFVMFFDLFQESSWDDPERDFQVWLKKRETEDKVMLVQILGVREILSLTLFSKRGSQADWQKTEELHRGMFANLQEEGKTEMAAKVQEMMGRLPELSQTWIKASEEWSNLIEGPLSNQSLGNWFWEENRKSVDRFTKRLRSE